MGLMDSKVHSFARRAVHDWESHSVELHEMLQLMTSMCTLMIYPARMCRYVDGIYVRSALHVAFEYRTRIYEWLCIFADQVLAP